MPVRFLNDPDDEKYQEATNKFEGKWHQGDFAEWMLSNGIIIHGRSDATQPRRFRIGTRNIRCCRYFETDQRKRSCESKLEWR